MRIVCVLYVYCMCIVCILCIVYRYTVTPFTLHNTSILSHTLSFCSHNTGRDCVRSDHSGASGVCCFLPPDLHDVP